MATMVFPLAFLLARLDNFSQTVYDVCRTEKQQPLADIGAGYVPKVQMQWPVSE